MFVLQRQQILQEEYRREQAEEQRVAAAQQDQGLQFGDNNKQHLNEERKREYQEYLAKVRILFSCILSRSQHMIDLYNNRLKSICSFTKSLFSEQKKTTLIPT